MKIIFFEVENWERPTFEKLNGGHQVECISEALVENNASEYASAEIVSTFIYSHLNAEVLQQLPRLKLIATRSTGFDHIDTEYCQKHGIKICNVPYYGDNTVAEHVFALLLAISHKIIEAVDRTRRGDFSLQGLQGFDLRGKTIGVIGTGAIGRYVIRIANGFQMNVLAFDIKPNSELESRFNFRYVSMDELLSTSDIITLHIPATVQTHHLLSKKEFDKMKKGMILINTARGSLIDNKAFLEAVSDRTIAAAALDVLPEEPAMREEVELLHSAYRQRYDLDSLLADHLTLRLRNVIVTPHSAFNTREAVQRILDVTVDNIATFARGENKNLVASMETSEKY